MRGTDCTLNGGRPVNTPSACTRVCRGLKICALLQKVAYLLGLSITCIALKMVCVNEPVYITKEPGYGLEHSVCLTPIKSLITCVSLTILYGLEHSMCLTQIKSLITCVPLTILYGLEHSVWLAQIKSLITCVSLNNSVRRTQSRKRSSDKCAPDMVQMTNNLLCMGQSILHIWPSSNHKSLVNCWEQFMWVTQPESDMISLTSSSEWPSLNETQLVYHLDQLVCLILLFFNVVISETKSCIASKWRCTGPHIYLC